MLEKKRIILLLFFLNKFNLRPNEKTFNHVSTYTLFNILRNVVDSDQFLTAVIRRSVSLPSKLLLHSRYRRAKAGKIRSTHRTALLSKSTQRILNNCSPVVNNEVILPSRLQRHSRVVFTLRLHLWLRFLFWTEYKIHFLIIICVITVIFYY